MTAENIAKALGGRWVGGGWTARCPAHDDHTPSLSISDGDGNKLLAQCHADCNQKQVIAAFRSCGQWAEGGRQQLCRSAHSHAKAAHKSAILWFAIERGEK
jgi:hypothetical protein